MGDLHVLHPGCSLLSPLQDLVSPGGRSPRKLRDGWEDSSDDQGSFIKSATAKLLKLRPPPPVGGLKSEADIMKQHSLSEDAKYDDGVVQEQVWLGEIYDMDYLW